MAFLAERLEEFCRRLLASPACASADEAFALLSRVLIEVEDELSGVAFDADYPFDDGRMYPPRADAERDVPGRADLRRYRSKRHNSFISDSGAILICDLKNNILLSKADSGRRNIEL